MPGGETLTGDDELLSLAFAQTEIGQGTDGGEHVSQSGPSAGTETGTLADAAFLAIASSDTGTGTDPNGSVGTGVAIFDFDSSHAIVTTPAQDSDRASFVDGKGFNPTDSDSATMADAVVTLKVLSSDTGAWD